MNPLISIIVPVYNVEAYLRKCLDSIVTQTYDNLEIILVNDGSIDNSGKICDEYMVNDCRITVIHQENLGIGFARNSGLKRCTGEYIMFVDSDDYLTHDAVNVLYNRLLTDESDLAIGKYIDVYADGSIDESRCRWITDCIFSSEEIYGNMNNDYQVSVVAWSKLYKRKLLKQIVFPPLCCGEDAWIFPEIIENCHRISVVNKLVYYYYQRSNSTMNNRSFDRIVDNIKANLHVSRYLLSKGYIESASYWYSASINESFLLNKQKIRLELFKQYFGEENRYILWNCVRMKTRIRWWIYLYIPLSKRFRDVLLRLNKKSILLMRK